MSCIYILTVTEENKYAMNRVTTIHFQVYCDTSLISCTLV